jgi:hypothetical protein
MRQQKNPDTQIEATASLQLQIKNHLKDAHTYRAESVNLGTHIMSLKNVKIQWLLVVSQLSPGI